MNHQSRGFGDNKLQQSSIQSINRSYVNVIKDVQDSLDILFRLCPSAINDPNIHHIINNNIEYDCIDPDACFRPQHNICCIDELIKIIDGHYSLSNEVPNAHDPVDAVLSIDTQSFDDENEVKMEVHTGIIHSNEVKEEFASLILEYKDIFARSWGDVGRFPVDPIKIRIFPDAVPLQAKSYIFGFGEMEILLDHLVKLEDADLICRSKSDWASPAFFVDKPGGGKRLVIDYKALNDVTIRDLYSIPDLNVLLAQLSGYLLFSNYDMRHGYYHVPLDRATKHRTAFITPYGLYEWNVLPMGLVNAPAIFQRVVDTVVDPIKHENMAYLDDIITKTKDPFQVNGLDDGGGTYIDSAGRLCVSTDHNVEGVTPQNVMVIGLSALQFMEKRCRNRNSSNVQQRHMVSGSTSMNNIMATITQNEGQRVYIIPDLQSESEVVGIVRVAVEQAHLRAIRRAFAQFRKWGVRLRLDKCGFFKTTIKFLGHIISAQGIEPNKDYLELIDKFKCPINTKQVARFLGMVQWIGKFVPLLSKYTCLLYTSPSPRDRG